MTTTPPAISYRPRPRTLALVEDAEWMAATGETMPGAAARLHIRPGSLRHALDHAGRHDITARLLANADPGYPVRGTIRAARRAA